MRGGVTRLFAICVLLGTLGCRNGFGDAVAVDAAIDGVVDASSDVASSSACVEGENGIPQASEVEFHFRFDAPVSMGQVVAEAGQTATCLAAECPGFRPGAIGAGSMHFDAVGRQYLRVDGTGVDLASGFSLSVWVRSDSIDGGGVSILSKTRGTPEVLDNSFFFGIDGDQVKFDTDDGSGSRSVLGAPGLTIDWQHVVVTFDGSSGRKEIWVDGVLGASDIVDGVPFNDRDLLIGADEDDLDVGDFLRGDLDDLRVYARALSEGEVTALGGCVAPTT